MLVCIYTHPVLPRIYAVTELEHSYSYFGLSHSILFLPKIYMYEVLRGTYSCMYHCEIVATLRCVILLVYKDLRFPLELRFPLWFPLWFPGQLVSTCVFG